MIAWIKPAGYPDPSYNGILAYSGQVAVNSGTLLSIQNNGKLSQAFWNNDAAQTLGNPVTLNQWNFVGFVYSGGTTIDFYINGNIVQSAAPLSGGIVAATTSAGPPARIGCTDNPGRCFNGQIEDAMIFNKALTANQIQALYNLDLSQ